MDNQKKKPTDNVVDKVVGYFNPEAGLRRKKARIVSDTLERAYEGASKGRRTDGWITFGGDADAELSQGGPLLRERSHDLVRNNPFGRRIVDVIVSNTIGYGIQGEFKTRDGAEDKRLTAEWKNWSDTPRCDFLGVSNYAGLQALAKRTIVESGSVLVRKVRVKPNILDPIPVKLMILEPDFIDTNKEDANTFKGIEYDSSGRKVAYWLFDRHPGNNKKGANLKSSRILASEIKHVFRVDRPGQSDGVPWFAPVIIALRELDEYMDATIVKQKVAAAFAAFVRDIEAPGDASIKKNTPLSDKIEPGAIEILPSGKDVTFPSPPSVSDFDPFVKAIIRMIAVGVGVSYGPVAGDYSMYNFSSSRMEWLEFHRNIEQWRWLMFIPGFCDGTAEWFLEGAALAGVIRNQADYVASWTAPRREMIDPTAETNAAVTALRGGIKSYPEVIRELGDDPKRKLAEIAEFNKLVDQLKIILDIDPRKVMKSGSFQTQPQQNQNKNDENGSDAEDGTGAT